MAKRWIFYNNILENAFNLSTKKNSWSAKTMLIGGKRKIIPTRFKICPTKNLPHWDSEPVRAALLDLISKDRTKKFSS